MKKILKQWLNIYKQKKRKRNTALRDISLEDHFRSMKQNQAVNNMRWLQHRITHPFPKLDRFECQDELNQSYLAIVYGLDIRVIVHKGKCFISFYKDGSLKHSFLFFNEDYPMVKRRCDGFIGYDTHALCTLLDVAIEKS